MEYKTIFPKHRSIESSWTLHEHKTLPHVNRGVELKEHEVLVRTVAGGISSWYTLRFRLSHHLTIAQHTAHHPIHPVLCHAVFIEHFQRTRVLLMCFCHPDISMGFVSNRFQHFFTLASRRQGCCIWAPQLVRRPRLARNDATFQPNEQVRKCALHSAT